jgi:hypothetical protein
MHSLSSRQIRVSLDGRFPRIVAYEGAGGTTIQGEPLAVPPRLYLHRRRDRATLTTDTAGVEAAYTLSVAGNAAVYRGRVACDGRPAAEFDVRIVLAGADLTLALEKVRESPGFYFLSLRLPHLVSAASLDGDSRALTCYGQGRLLDPAKCKPMLVDYNWHFAIARMCSAVIRPRLAVTLDIPAYDDLFIVNVWQYSRPAQGSAYASAGVELMYRQRPVEDPNRHFMPPQHATLPMQIAPPDPILCAKRKEVRLHVLAARGRRPLDWTDVARYFQSLVPTRARCQPLYRDALVYKTVFVKNIEGAVYGPVGRYPVPLSFEEAEAHIQRIHHLTDGMRQVCYFTFFQHKLADSGWPWTFDIHPAVGGLATLRRIVREAPRWNACVSFHANFDVFSNDTPSFDPRMVAYAVDGRPQSQGVWGLNQLYYVSLPRYRATLRKLLARMVRTYGLRKTLHLDTYTCHPYLYDSGSHAPANAADFVAAKRGIVRDARAQGLDITSEALTDPYVGWIGHAWTLFNYGTFWEGEEAVPLANFIYHGAVSWNAGHACNSIAYFSDRPSPEDTILGMLIQGGGLGLEFPQPDAAPGALADLLYLVQPPYMMLRDRKWTGYTRRGAIRRVDYASRAPGARSFIEVDTARPGYRVVVDGVTVARDFVTVLPGRRKGTLLAFSRHDTELDWPVPAGWPDGAVRAVTLTETGPGVRVDARVEKRRLRLVLRAHQPVRIGPR